MQGEVELPIEIKVALCCQTLILVNAHLLGLVKCFLLYEFSHLFQNFKLFGDWWAVGSFYQLLAAGAIHEGKRDTKCAPSVLKKLSDAIGMKDMTTTQLDTRFFGELTRVAYTAKFCLWRQATCYAFRL